MLWAICFLLWVAGSWVRGFLPHLIASSRSCAVNKISRASGGFDSIIDRDIARRLEDRFQVIDPNSIQADALEIALSGQDLIVLAQTGSGKTMTFLLPILQRIKNNPEASALILAPTELLLEQHQHIAEQLLPGSVSGITFSTPQDLLQNDTLKADWAIVALDEVDAVLYGGCDDDALTPIGANILKMIPETAQCIVTTAYLSKAHETSLLRRDFPAAEFVREQVTSGRSGVLVPTLRQRFKYFAGGKESKLVDVLRGSTEDSWLSAGSTIVFCGTVESAKEVHSCIQSSMTELENLSLLHDDLDQESRAQVLKTLRRPDESMILICTDMAARGLDLPNVRHVILYSVPTDIGAFVHQVGRTARRGQQGLLTCLVLTGSADYARYTHLHALKSASKLFSSSS